MTQDSKSNAARRHRALRNPSDNLNADEKKRQVDREKELQDQADLYAKLSPEEQWALAEVWLRKYYDFMTKDFIWTCVIVCDKQDAAEARWHLAALSKVLGKDELRKYENDFCDNKIRPELGLRVYNAFMYGTNLEEVKREILAEWKENSKDTMSLPTGGIVRSLGRDIYDRLLNINTDSRFEYVEDTRSATITFVSRKDRGWIELRDEGYLGYGAARDICHSCPWDDPKIFDYLNLVLSELSGVDIKLDL